MGKFFSGIFIIFTTIFIILMVVSYKNKLEIKRAKSHEYIVLAGSGEFPRETIKWMEQKATNKNVVVLTADADLNDRMLIDFDDSFDIEYVLIDNKKLANSIQIIRKINNAGILILSGGDQYNYTKWWVGTKTEEAINQCIHTGIPVAGASAGAMVLGECYFTSKYDSAYSNECLLNPYARVDLCYNFLHSKYLKDTNVDSHYNNRNRQGRHLAFLCGMLQNTLNPKGIGIDEKTALIIEDGIATVYGEGNVVFLSNIDVTTYEKDKPLECEVIAITLEPFEQFSLINKDWNPLKQHFFHIWKAHEGKLDTY